jgi:hypothetical protein
LAEAQPITFRHCKCGHEQDHVDQSESSIRAVNIEQCEPRALARKAALSCTCHARKLGLRVVAAASFRVHRCIAALHQSGRSRFTLTAGDSGDLRLVRGEARRRNSE